MLKIGQYIGEIIDPAVDFMVNFTILAIRLLIIISIICVPIAAVKYIFFG